MRTLALVLACASVIQSKPVTSQADVLASGPFAGLSTKRVGDPTSFRVEGEHGVFRITSTTTRINDGYRAELSDLETPDVGATVRYRLRTRLSAETPFADLKGSVVIAQWHDAKLAGIPAQRPPLSLRIRNGMLHVVMFNDAVFNAGGMTGDGQALFSMPLDKGRWYDFDFVVKWSPTNEGSVQAKINGADVIKYTGPVGYVADTVAPYFKFGAYTVHTPPAPLEIWHSGFQREIR